MDNKVQQKLNKLLEEKQQIELRLAHIKQMKHQPFFVDDAENIINEALYGWGDQEPRADLQFAIMSSQLNHDEEEQKDILQAVNLKIAKLEGKREVAAQVKKLSNANKMQKHALSGLAKNKIDVALYLKSKYPHQAINPSKLWELPENIKRAGREFLKSELQTLKKGDTVKEVFRKPRPSQERTYSENDYR